jgi:hypothetical protein
MCFPELLAVPLLAEAGGAAGAAATGVEGGLAAGDAAAMASTVAGAGGEAGLASTVGGYAGAYGSAAYSGLGGANGLLAAGSAGLSAYSNYAQASAAQQAASYQAQLAANNARLSQQEGNAAIDQGQSQAMQSSQQASQLLGEQKAAFGGNGVSLGSGSALDVMASTRFLNDQDVNTIQSNAARTAWGYGVQAANDQTQANLSAWQARNNNPLAIAAAGGASSLLGTASLYALGNKGNLLFSNA